ncbi:hypothetical protein [Accumulibacter sp.]|uniref:hypothetical protein n=1 Tax=Accumulibacter sp. TaxID=2053492 RepID=UPI00159AB4F4|nr:MAG: hypothetical protein HT579_05810 [Candidatus Accumulibacter similis]
MNPGRRLPADAGHRLLSHCHGHLLWLLLVLLPVLAGAQQEMEMMTLRHRTLDQVLPALQPLVESGGTLSTTISGRLGEWLELGSSSQQAGFERGGNLHGSGGQASERRSIWLQVEELP